MMSKSQPSINFAELLRNSVNAVETVATLNFDGVMSFDRQCRYTLWNPGMERITGGVNADQLLGQEAFAAFPFLKAIGEEKHFLDTLQGGSSVSMNRPFTIMETGKRGFFDANYGPLLSDDKEVIGGLTVVREVTHRVLREQFLEKTRDINIDEYETSGMDTVPRELLKTLGRAIYERRRLMSMSQEELGFKANLHRTYISDIERGLRNISMCNFVRLARALSIEPWVLLSWSELAMTAEP